MKKTTFLLMLISFVTFGQTKKIFHKSHSGKPGTIFLDEKNNFGPGMAPVRYRTPESNIQLNYIKTDNHFYPKVILDTINKTMLFHDTKDSLIGCDRDYREYLNHGSLVFDLVTSEFWVYQLYFFRWDKKQVRTARFLSVSDSLLHWETNPRFMRNSNNFIRDGNNFRILMKYPILDYTITSNLKPELINPKESFPIIIGDKIKKKEKKKSKLLLEEIRLKTDKMKKNNYQQKEDELVLLPKPTTPPFNLWLVWMGIFFFVFSIFMFLGVKQIVKEEINNLNLRNK
jgi:hypothetical protein